MFPAFHLPSRLSSNDLKPALRQIVYPYISTDGMDSHWIRIYSHDSVVLCQRSECISKYEAFRETSRRPLRSFRRPVVWPFLFHLKQSSVPLSGVSIGPEALCNMKLNTFCQ